MGSNGIIAARRAAVALGVAAAALGVTTMPAQAEGLSAFCEKGGLTLNATAHYVNSGAYHVWTSMSYKVGGSHLGDKSNVAWSVKEAGRTVYSSKDETVPADIVQNQPNSPQPRTYGGYAEAVVFYVKWDRWFHDDDLDEYATTRNI